MDRLAYTVQEVAAAIGVSEMSVYRAIDAGTLPAKRITPRRIVIPAAALDRWLDEKAAA